MKKRKFGLYFRVGIEMGNFVLSGLADKLKQNGSEVHILADQTNQVFENMLKQYDLPKYDLRKFELHKQERHKIEGYFLASRRARLRLDGHQTFAYWNQTVTKRKKDILLGNKLTYALLEFFASKKIPQQYHNKHLVDFFKTEGFTDIVLQTYAMPQNMAMAINAKAAGCNVWLMNWGWKDFHINEWVPFSPNKFFVWSEKYKQFYLKYNSHLKDEQVIAVGNPNFDSHFKYKPIFDKHYYAKKYDFDPNKSVFVYAMIHPDAYFHENHIIEQLVKELKINGNEDIQIILKPNPMDKNLERYKGLLRKYDNLSMMDNLWSFDKEADFNLITQEAKTEWLDMIYHSTGMITIPSTVSIESLILKKPVISIGYGANEKDNQEILRFANAGFYYPLFHRKDVVLSKKVDETLHYIQRIIDGNIKVQDSISEFLDESGNATDIIVNTMMNIGTLNDI